MQKHFEIKKAAAYPLGVSFCEEGLRVAAVRSKEGLGSEEEFGLILYDRKHRDGVRIPFPEGSGVGAVHAMLLAGYHNRECSYLFYSGENIWQDPFCRKLANPYRYGVRRKSLPRCMAQDGAYDWEGDETLRYPYEDVILYALHVRGFTKHRTSGVAHRGTYTGLTEKIPYLRELGITSLLLMPAYEFDEIMDEEPAPAAAGQAAGQAGAAEAAEETKACRLNYWGYQKGLYYMPKTGYADGRDAVTEFRDMVKKLHANGIEVLMQFYFPPEITPTEMLDILKFWVLEYHIDGFHVMGVDLPIDMFTKEPLLCETKLLTSQHCEPNPASYMARTRRLGWMSDGFLYDMRKALKGDDNMVNQLLSHMRRARPETGIVNYIAKWDGLRLADMVAYDRKHNEGNGEDNRDGTDYNCSWNCGVEGKSRRKSIQELRLRQMKNALSLVFLSQGTPLLYSGDEFGNTQEGNNNPYCQDNAVAWIKWNHTETGKELSDYTKLLIRLRKEHPILCGRTPLKGMDYLSCGYPDISYHGREAWRPDVSPASRSVGIMFCGRYGETEGRRDDTFFYIGINLYWNAYDFGLPQLPGGRKWALYASSDPQGALEVKTADSADGQAQSRQAVCVAPRTIVIYVSEDCSVEETAQSGAAKPETPRKRKRAPRRSGKEA